MNYDSRKCCYSIKISQVISSVEYKRILERVETLLSPFPVEKRKEVSLRLAVNKVNYVKEKFSLFGENAIKYFLSANEQDIPSDSVSYDTRRQLDYLKFEDFGYHTRYEEVTSLPPSQFMKMRSMNKLKQIHFSLIKAKKYKFVFPETLDTITVSIESGKRATGSSVKSCQLLQQTEQYSLSLTVTLKQPIGSISLSDYFRSTPSFFRLWEMLYCSMKEYPVSLGTNEKKKTVIESYNQITQSKKEFVAFIGTSVVSFNFGNLKGGLVDIWDKEDRFSVTSKTDGLRYIGVFISSRLFLVGKGGGDVIDFGIQFEVSESNNLEQTIVDGEWVCDYTQKRSHYLIFDIYFFKGKDVRYLDLKSRLELIHRHDFTSSFKIDAHNIYADILIQVKKFLFPGGNATMTDAIQEILEDMKTMTYGCDGIIFTRNVPLIGLNKWSLVKTVEDEDEFEAVADTFVNTGKTWTSVIKWKPHTMLTVDFKVVFINEEQVEFHTLLSSFDALDRNAVKNSFSTYGSNISKTRISEKVKLTSRRCRNGDEITSGNIVEVLFVEEEISDSAFTTTLWEPQRVRSDKQVPNLESVAKENYILSRYPITEQDLLDQRRYEVFDQGDPRLYDSVTLYKTENHEKSFIKPMTQLHMRLKRQFIERTVFQQKKEMGQHKLRILDLACGRFGEIQIWTKGCLEESIELFLGIDYSENEISDLHGGANIRLLEQSKRCHHSFDNFLFLQGDCSKPIGTTEFSSCSKYTTIYESLLANVSSPSLSSFPLFHGIFNKKFHLCTMQFALHYFCSPEDDYQALHTLAENISSSLLEGGNFFGTCIDGTLMRKELDKGDLVIKSPCGKEVLSIRRENTNLLGVFVFIESIGQEIFEFYVDFDVVNTIFEEHSLFVSEKVLVEDFLSEDTKKLSELQPFLRFSGLHTMFVYQKRCSVL